MFKTSLLDLINNDTSNKKYILTFSKELDDILGGGIPLGQITEFCGSPGSAKTQLCLQLCVNVQIPFELGGINGKAIFIDTQCQFNANRLEEIVNGTINRIQKISRKIFNKEIDDFNNQNIMNNIYVQHVNSYQRLLEIIKSLKEILLHDIIKLIIIDSFTFLMKMIQNSYDRKCVIYDILNELHSIICNKEIAVVITNQITTELTFDEQEVATEKLVPSSGESQSHKINQRICFYTNHERNGYFIAKLMKSLTHPKSTAEFLVTENGMQ